jgi:hypothetical protein
MQFSQNEFCFSFGADTLKQKSSGSVCVTGGPIASLSCMDHLGKGE